jgi:hypothetical protein
VKEKFTEGRLDRRGFLAAAGAAAATGAAASTMGPLSGAAGGKTSAKAIKSGADDGLCREHPAELPKIRRGIQTYTTPATAWNTKELFVDHIKFLKSLELNAWEFAGAYPVVDGVNLGTNPAGWATFGSYAKEYGFRIVGTHDGPNAATAANLGSAITKMNGWNCNHLGAGSGWPGVPGAGTAITTPATISAWQASCATMNSWGRAFQTGSGAGVLTTTPYDVGLFNGNPVSGRPCARYYRHFHSEQGKWITGTGTKYDNNYISAVAYTELDPKYAYAQSDLCWLLDGLWMSGGGPSIGLQGAGDPNPGQGKNRLFAPDIIERWQDRIPMFHVKDLGPNDQGTQVANVGDNNGPGAATYPFGAVPYSFDQDTVPFQQIFERLRHPERHEYLFERDGQSGTVTSNAYYKKLYVQVSDMYDKILLDRTSVRKPFVFPVTDADWAAIAVTAIGQRPPETAGAPGAACAPKIEGGSEVGDTVEVTDVGVWSRFSEKPRNYNYIWLRDGAPLAKYNGAPIGDQNSACTVDDAPTYTLTADDVGHEISAQVTALNPKSNQDSGTSQLTNAIRVMAKPLLGTRTKGSGSSTISAGLPEAYQATSSGAGTVSKLEVYVEEGTTANWLVAGIYSNYHNHPDLLLATGETRISNHRQGGWVTVDIGNVKLAKDTKYWIAVLGLGGDLNVANYDGSNGWSPSETYKRTKGDAAELPTAWKTGTVYKHDGPLTAAAG